eukprot:TRINITY_DN11214_c0_g1_i1.p1 TRINITY_DN11214_c0_g1~~TRINITY_DN11214_c0_g1_i1.p1  ORF type:complete len:615 (-),score=149.77 TRINITY_DN11214_c0_g1_i1:529-2220(-)
MKAPAKPGAPSSTTSSAPSFFASRSSSSSSMPPNNGSSMPPTRPGSTATHTAATSSSSSSSSHRGGGASVPSTSGAPAPHIMEEIEQRASMLASNKELRLLHDNLVKPGIIKENEFWEARKSMLSSDSQNVSKQKVGLATTLREVKPSSESGDTVSYKLDPAAIIEIFTQFPAVRKAYHENVPLKLTELEFWKRYFKSKHFHRDRLRAPQNIQQQSASEGDDMFAKYVEDDRERFKRRVHSLDPSGDLSAEADTKLPDGYGVRTDDTMRPAKLAKSLPLIRRFNKHGAVVVGESDTAEAEPSVAIEKAERYRARMKENVRISELDEEPADTFVPLRIQDQRRYFEGYASTSNGDDAESLSSSSFTPEEAIDAFSSNLQGWIPDLYRAQTSHDDAALINREMNTLLVTSSSTVNNNNNGSGSGAIDLTPIATDIDTKLSSSFRASYLDIFDTTNELLRHFWSTMPTGSLPLSAASTEKVGRLVKMLRENQIKLEGIVKQESEERVAKEKEKEGAKRKKGDSSSASDNKAKIDEERKIMGNIVATLGATITKAIEKHASLPTKKS